MRVIAVQHCPMVYESAFETVSLHRTKKGAARAMNKLKAVHDGEMMHKRLAGLGIEFQREMAARRISEYGHRGFEAYRYLLIEVGE